MEISKTLRKRYYLVEKAKNASIIGEVPLLEGMEAGLQHATGKGRRQHPCNMLTPCVGPQEGQARLLAETLCCTAAHAAGAMCAHGLCCALSAPSLPVTATQATLQLKCATCHQQHLRAAD